MIKKLKRIKEEVYYYENGKKILGVHSKITGNISSRLTGNISGLTGNISSGLTGNISGLRGDISGLIGIATNIEGNLDYCEITEKERRKTIKIDELIEETEENLK